MHFEDPMVLDLLNRLNAMTATGYPNYPLPCNMVESLLLTIILSENSCTQLETCLASHVYYKILVSRFVWSQEPNYRTLFYVYCICYFATGGLVG